MNKIVQIISLLTISSALIMIVVVVYWLIYPYKVADFNNLPFPIMNENKTVSRGERLRYFIDYCKYTDTMPELTKFIIDGVVYEMPKTVGIAHKGCNNAVSDVYIPRSIPSGTYHLKTVARYKVNPLRTIEIVNETEAFTVK